MPDIKTTHTGSLPRDKELVVLLNAQEDGLDCDDLDERIDEAVETTVRRQSELGIDIVNDGEQGKPSYATYVRYRLTGFEGAQTERPPRADNEFADLVAQAPKLVGASTAYFPSCIAPISLRDPGAVHRDIARLKAAADSSGIGTDHLFLSSASPGLIANSFGNEYYPNRSDYLAAIIEAMREEYRAVVEAGFVLQLDCPDMASAYSARYRTMTIADFRVELEQSVEALNAAVEGLDPALMRIHLCWGNYEGPHLHDVELQDIVDVILKASPNGLSLEACNPRHGHEWAVFEDLPLPEGKYLIPGVIDTTTNFVEHPRLVAQRLGNYTRLLGKERVQAGTDCGFGTFAGPRRVAPSVAWTKLGSLVEGARLAGAARH